MSDVILSILICHLPDRVAMLAGLRAIIDPQCEGRLVEVLVNGGGGSTGQKRNELLSRAKGEYVAFIDDDDEVADDYCQRIVTALDELPDCIGIEGIVTRGGRNRVNPKKFVHSIDCKTWFENNGTYYRTPNHLNPVRRSLALKVGFPDKTVGEDRAFSDAIFPLLKHEVFVSGPPLYFYLAE